MKALLTICTGKYHDFLQPLISSTDQHLKGDWAYHVFSDKVPQVVSKRAIMWHYVEHKTWPNSTLMRYHFFTHYADYLKHYEDLVYTDVDMKFVGDCDFDFTTDLFGNGYYSAEYVNDVSLAN